MDDSRVDEEKFFLTEVLCLINEEDKLKLENQPFAAPSGSRHWASPATNTTESKTGRQDGSLVGSHQYAQHLNGTKPLDPEITLREMQRAEKQVQYHHRMHSANSRKWKMLQEK